MLETEKLYYLQPHVRSRIAEYCGAIGDDPSTCSAEFLVGDGHTTHGLGIPRSENVALPFRLDDFLGRGIDVFRSLWDRRSVLDLDYANADFVDEAFYNPRRFEKRPPIPGYAPSERRICQILLSVLSSS